MSINNFSSDHTEALWWAQQQQQQQQQPRMEFKTHHPWSSQLSWLHSQEPSSSMQLSNQNNNNTFKFNLNSTEEDDATTATEDPETEQQEHQHPQRVQEFEKQTMFEKPLTPSDVGKLNRLVIPKQHAEKNFPLSGESVEKGLLLSFEDELGKCWRFRYSYWNSSQSYVLTKGWSRYVKEKRLDAGDVVFFAKDRADSDRLFIGWRRRGVAGPPHEGGGGAKYGRGDGGWSSTSRLSILRTTGQQQQQQQGYPYHPRHNNHHGAHGHVPSLPYQPDSFHAAAGSVGQHQTAATTAVGNSSSKTLRLFGVNLECQLDDSEPSTPDSSSWSGQSYGQTQAYHQMQYYSEPYYSSHQNSHMDITFCEDVKQQMRNHRG